MIKLSLGHLTVFKWILWYLFAFLTRACSLGTRTCKRILFLRLFVEGREGGAGGGDSNT